MRPRLPASPLRFGELRCTAPVVTPSRAGDHRSDEILAGEVVTEIDDAIELERKIFVQHPSVQTILDQVWYAGGEADRKAQVMGGGWHWHMVASAFYFITLPYFVMFAPARLNSVNRPKQRFWVYQAQYTALLICILNLAAVEDVDPADPHLLDILVLVWLAGKLLSEADEALQARKRHKLSWWETAYGHVFSDYWNTMARAERCRRPALPAARALCAPV